MVSSDSYDLYVCTRRKSSIMIQNNKREKKMKIFVYF